jgi:hypothetical protein
MNKPNWLTIDSKNLKQGNIIIISIGGLKCLGIVLTDATQPFITIPLLVDGHIKIIRLLEGEIRLEQ